MSDDETDGGTQAQESPVVRTISPDPAQSEYEFLEIIAELEGREIDELPSLYNEVEHLIETPFRKPPSPQAQAEMTLSYAGYRVRIDQQGTIELLNVKQSAE
jgi:hypothetical protein